MKMQNTPRVEPTFDGDAPSTPAPLNTVDSVDTAWPDAGEPIIEPQLAPPAGAVTPEPPASAPAKRPLPVKTMVLGGVLAAGLAGAIAWIGSSAEAQRHRPPEPQALAAAPGMSAKALPAFDAHTIAPPPVVQSAMQPPSEPQVAAMPPPLPPAGSAAVPAPAAAPATTARTTTSTPVSAAPAAAALVAAVPATAALVAAGSTAPHAPHAAPAAPARAPSPLTSRSVAPVVLAAAAPTAAKSPTAPRHTAPKASVKKVSKTVKLPKPAAVKAKVKAEAKASTTRAPRKQAAAKSARKVAPAAKPRCDAQTRNTARCRAAGKAGKS